MKINKLFFASFGSIMSLIPLTTIAITSPKKNLDDNIIKSIEKDVSEVESLFQKLDQTPTILSNASNILPSDLRTKFNNVFLKSNWEKRQKLHKSEFPKFFGFVDPSLGLHNGVSKKFFYEKLTIH